MTTLQLTTRERCNRLTVVVIMAMATMLFAAFAGAYLIRRTAADWQPVPLPGLLAITTAIIVLSSITMELAKRGSSPRWLGATIALALAFLAGQIVAWQQLGAAGYGDLRIIHGAFFVTLASVHAVHLLGGIAVLLRARKRPELIGLCAPYWHFVGIVWILLYTMLSLL